MEQVSKFVQLFKKEEIPQGIKSNEYKENSGEKIKKNQHHKNDNGIILLDPKRGILLEKHANLGFIFHEGDFSFYGKGDDNKFSQIENLIEDVSDTYEIFFFLNTPHNISYKNIDYEDISCIHIQCSYKELRNFTIVFSGPLCDITMCG